MRVGAMWHPRVLPAAVTQTVVRPPTTMRVSPKPLSCELQGGNSLWVALVPSSYIVLQLSGCHQYYR